MRHFFLVHISLTVLWAQQGDDLQQSNTRIMLGPLTLGVEQNLTTGNSARASFSLGIGQSGFTRNGTAVLQHTFGKNLHRATVGAGLSYVEILSLRGNVKEKMVVPALTFAYTLHTGKDPSFFRAGLDIQPQSFKRAHSIVPYLAMGFSF
jgi:hypothetical protein